MTEWIRDAGRTEMSPARSGGGWIVKAGARVAIGLLFGAGIIARGADADPESRGSGGRSPAGLLVIQEARPPRAREDWIRSFADEGYVVDTRVWTDPDDPAPALGALARMQLQLAEDAVLVVILDLPAILSGGPSTDASVIWAPPGSASSGASAGRAGFELMNTLVSWGAPSRGRLVVLALQPPHAAPPDVIEASRRAFESPEHGPFRRLAWPAPPGAVTERSPRGPSLLETCLSDSDLPRRLKEPGFPSVVFENAFRRVRALAGGRQEPVLWAAPGVPAAPPSDSEHAALAAAARSPADVSSWDNVFRAAREGGRYPAALGLAFVAARLAGSDPMSRAQWAMARADVQIRMGDPAAARRDLQAGAEGIVARDVPLPMKFEYAVLKGELEEAEGRGLEAAAAWGEALNIHALLNVSPPDLDARMFCGLGRTASAAGRTAEARQRFDQAWESAIRIQPPRNDLTARIAADRARWHAKTGDWNAAGEWCLRAMDAASSLPWLDDYIGETARWVAERMSTGGGPEPALELMNRARRKMGDAEWMKSPGWARIQVRLDLGAGRWEEAARGLSRIPAEAHADDPDWLELEAAIQRFRGDGVSAVDLYRQALIRMRGDPGSRERMTALDLALASCYLDMNQPNQALSASESILDRPWILDEHRAEATRLAMRAALAANVPREMIRHARTYIRLNREPETTIEEARWMLDASVQAREAGDRDLAVGLARRAMIAAGNAGIEDRAFWAEVREAHARALPASRTRAWSEALEALRLLEINQQDISRSGVRVRLLLSQIAREQGEPARAAFYLSGAVAVSALSGLNSDSEVVRMVRSSLELPDRGSLMPPAAGHPADHQRYEAAAAAIR